MKKLFFIKYNAQNSLNSDFMAHALARSSTYIARNKQQEALHSRENALYDITR